MTPTARRYFKVLGGGRETWESDITEYGDVPTYHPGRDQAVTQKLRDRPLATAVFLTSRDGACELVELARYLFADEWDDEKHRLRVSQCLTYLRNHIAMIFNQGVAEQLLPPKDTLLWPLAHQYYISDVVLARGKVKTWEHEAQFGREQYAAAREFFPLVPGGPQWLDYLRLDLSQKECTGNIIAWCNSLDHEMTRHSVRAHVGVACYDLLILRADDYWERNALQPALGHLKEAVRLDPRQQDAQQIYMLMAWQHRHHFGGEYLVAYKDWHSAYINSFKYRASSDQMPIERQEVYQLFHLLEDGRIEGDEVERRLWSLVQRQLGQGGTIVVYDPRPGPGDLESPLRRIYDQALEWTYRHHYRRLLARVLAGHLLSLMPTALWPWPSVERQPLAKALLVAYPQSPRSPPQRAALAPMTRYVLRQAAGIALKRRAPHVEMEDLLQAFLEFGRGPLVKLLEHWQLDPTDWLDCMKADRARR